MSGPITKEIAQEAIHCIYCKKELDESASSYELKYQVHVSCQAEIEIYKDSRGKLPDDVFKEFQSFFKKYNIVQYQFLTNKELYNLRSLNLNDKRIPNVPKYIHYLTNLRKLGLGGNLLTDLPEELGWMKNLEMINLSCNNFTEVPAVLGSLSALKKVMYAGNNLEVFPKIFRDFPNLEVLDLSNNKLEVIPDEIKTIKTLTALYGKHNKLMEVPEGVKQLSNLRTLVLANNRINKIPLWIAQKHYNHLDLTNNPIEDLDLKLQRLRVLLLHGVVLNSN